MLPAPNAVPTPNSDPKRATSAQVRRSVNVRHIKMHYFTSHVALNTCAVHVLVPPLARRTHVYMYPSTHVGSIILRTRSARGLATGVGLG